MNLFMNSFKHLQETAPEEDTPVSVKKAENKPSINLGAGKKFEDPEAAYTYLLGLPAKDIPPGFRNVLTKSFFHGTEEGQVNTLFKDWKLYKEKMLPKISEFFSYIKGEKEKYVQCAKYIKLLQDSKNPVEYLQDDKVDLTYFKFWTLFKFFTQKGTMSK